MDRKIKAYKKIYRKAIEKTDLIMSMTELKHTLSDFLRCMPLMISGNTMFIHQQVRFMYMR